MVFIYGTLHKKSLLAWKERFLVLRGNTLSCFKRKEDAEPTSTYTITGDVKIEKLGKGVGFSVKIGTKTLRLKAEKEKQEAEWVSTLEKVAHNEYEKVNLKPVRSNTKLWWAETKQGQFCFELDDFYEMRRTIGSGGYGVVVAAVNKRNDTKVAVKKIVNSFDDVLVAKRMAREIRILKQLDHVNVIKLVDLLPPVSADTFNDIYMVLERMDTDLHRIIYSGQHLKEAHMQFFVYQIMCALRYIHSAAIIHRDLKPANILVNTTCDLKLCDFGLARSMNRGAAEEDLTEYVVTRWWRAPEVFLESEYTQAIDMWSVGCILAEMITRKPLFMGANTAQMLKLIVAFTGKTPTTDLTFVTNRKACAYILSMPDTAPASLAVKFPLASPAACDLLAGLLHLNPANRLTVEQALQHPWLQPFHVAEQEQTAAKPVDLAAIEDARLTRQSMQELLFEDVCHYRPEILGQPPGANTVRELPLPPPISTRPLPPIVATADAGGPPPPPIVALNHKPTSQAQSGSSDSDDDSEASGLNDAMYGVQLNNNNPIAA